MSDAERIAALERQVHALMEELIWLAGLCWSVAGSGAAREIQTKLTEATVGDE